MSRLEPKRLERRIEVITGGGRRRWTVDEKARIVAETPGPGAVVSVIARRHGLTPSSCLFGGVAGVTMRVGNSGAEYWAVIASPVETCKLLDVEPHWSRSTPDSRLNWMKNGGHVTLGLSRDAELRAVAWKQRLL